VSHAAHRPKQSLTSTVACLDYCTLREEKKVKKRKKVVKSKLSFADDGEDGEGDDAEGASTNHLIRLSSQPFIQGRLLNVQRPARTPRSTLRSCPTANEKSKNARNARFCDRSGSRSKRSSKQKRLK